MTLRRAGARWVTLVIVCSAAGCAPKPAAPPVDPAKSSRQLILGTGALCNTDKACGEGPWTGACVLGTCFGLLTTETQAVRATLLERIHRAPPPVQQAVVNQLLKALSHPMSSVTTRVGAVQGLGATLQATGPCGEACKAVVASAREPDEPVAVSARLALSRRAELSVLPKLLKDTREGTEHLRCSATRAIGRYASTKASRQTDAGKSVVQALMLLLDDRAPNIRRAAAETLARWHEQPNVAKALREAATRHPGDLRYVVARAQLAVGEAP